MNTNNILYKSMYVHTCINIRVNDTLKAFPTDFLCGVYLFQDDNMFRGIFVTFHSVEDPDKVEFSRAGERRRKGRKEREEREGERGEGETTELIFAK